MSSFFLSLRLWREVSSLVDLVAFHPNSWAKQHWSFMDVPIIYVGLWYLAVSLYHRVLQAKITDFQLSASHAQSMSLFMRTYLHSDFGLHLMKRSSERGPNTTEYGRHADVVTDGRASLRPLDEEVKNINNEHHPLHSRFGWSDRERGIAHCCSGITANRTKENKTNSTLASVYLLPIFDSVKTWINVSSIITKF
jgi:hypothetical protein